MKYIMLLVAMLMIAMLPSSAQRKAQIQFEKVVYDYDTIVQNGNGECSFTFRNVGNAPLIITKTSASCGCTTPSYDPHPIMPGEKGVVRVLYNTALVGNFRKTVVVNSNASNSPTSILTIKGFVKKAKHPKKPHKR